MKRSSISGGRGHQRPQTGPRCVCGKVIYHSRSAARQASRQRHDGKRPYLCDVSGQAGVFHLGDLTEEVKNGTADRESIYAKSPEEIEARRLVGIRSRRGCETCGAGGYEFSHRRTRAVGDDHQWCACNATNSCHSCHRWLHDHPADAMVLGLMVSRFENEPSTVPVRLKTGWGLLHCNGTVTQLGPEQVDTDVMGRPVLVA